MLNINYITKQYYKSHLDELKKKNTHMDYDLKVKSMSKI